MRELSTGNPLGNGSQTDTVVMVQYSLYCPVSVPPGLSPRRFMYPQDSGPLSVAVMSFSCTTAFRAGNFKRLAVDPSTPTVAAIAQLGVDVLNQGEAAHVPQECSTWNLPPLWGGKLHYMGHITTFNGRAELILERRRVRYLIRVLDADKHLGWQTSD